MATPGSHFSSAYTINWVVPHAIAGVCDSMSVTFDILSCFDSSAMHPMCPSICLGRHVIFLLDLCEANVHEVSYMLGGLVVGVWFYVQVCALLGALGYPSDHGADVSSVLVRPPPPPAAPPCPPGPLSYQGSIATGHTYGGARKKILFPLPTWHLNPNSNPNQD